MLRRIHILGASGSGTTTLGQELASQLKISHYDTDDYYWLPTEPPFQKVRAVKERQSLLMRDLEGHNDWILTGSLCGWGDIFIPMFDLVVFLWIPTDIRMKRLMERETRRYGLETIQKGGRNYDATKAFMEWNLQYDTGGMEIRSRTLHEAWLSNLTCSVLRLEGDLTIKERSSLTMDKILHS